MSEQLSYEYPAEVVEAAQEPRRPHNEYTLKVELETAKSFSQTFLTPATELEQIRLCNRIERFIRDCVIEFELEERGSDE